MKIRIFALILAAALLLTGCAVTMERLDSQENTLGHLILP